MNYCRILIASICVLVASYSINVYAHPKTQSVAHSAKHKINSVKDGDIATAVKAASIKDCGCGECAAKGCKPCHGKNCFYCAAKGLTTKECGCGMCGAEGCTDCGPGCDVCKFHLKPVKEAKKKPK
ncbi:MAG: hypothetical protein HY033_13740 [Ignavibacteriae bacterium]|nr:hypothetical protein [Ignavibacteria bacterium]MBI3365954.1 hypothetical protein [Ignavibacteriota bacterium]